MEETIITENNSQSIAQTGKKPKFGVLGTRMKEYEEKFVTRIDKNLPYIIRLDGHKFSTFTRPMNKPFDIRFRNAMVSTTKQLVEVFRPFIGYTCSDEITLAYPIYLDQKTNEMKTICDYGGKVTKLVSLTASYASVCFYNSLKEELIQSNDQKLLEHIEKVKPHFDSRVFNVKDNNEIVNNLKWRATYDYRRNSISNLSQSHFSSKQLHGKNKREQLELLKTVNVYWDTQPDWYKFGTCVKKKEVMKTIEVDGKEIVTKRSVIECRDKEIFKKGSAEQDEWILAKFWPEPSEITEIAQSTEEKTDIAQSKEEKVDVAQSTPEKTDIAQVTAEKTEVTKTTTEKN